MSFYFVQETKVCRFNLVRVHPSVPGCPPQPQFTKLKQGSWSEYNINSDSHLKW